ncbi:MAG: hypothetical protein EZS28_045541, partial [Streblomastix strix]
IDMVRIVIHSIEDDDDDDEEDIYDENGNKKKKSKITIFRTIRAIFSGIIFLINKTSSLFQPLLANPATGAHRWLKNKFEIYKKVYDLFRGHIAVPIVRRLRKIRNKSLDIMDWFGSLPHKLFLRFRNLVQEDEDDDGDEQIGQSQGNASSGSQEHKKTKDRPQWRKKKRTKNSLYDSDDNSSGQLGIFSGDASTLPSKSMQSSSSFFSFFSFTPPPEPALGTFFKPSMFSQKLFVANVNALWGSEPLVPPQLLQQNVGVRIIYPDQSKPAQMVVDTSDIVPPISVTATTQYLFATVTCSNPILVSPPPTVSILGRGDRMANQIMYTMYQHVALQLQTPSLHYRAILIPRFNLQQQNDTRSSRTNQQHSKQQKQKRDEVQRGKRGGNKRR